MYYTIHNPKICPQVKTDTEADKIWQLENEVEILKEQIETLKLQMCYKSHELEEAKQELSCINHELYAVYELYAVSADLLTINEVKELSKNLVAREKPTKDVLVE